jgi:acetyltransferase-like isoleucine patch superfamily enzyme
MPDSMRSHRVWFEDPLNFFSRATVKLYSMWVSTTYPFASLGRKLSIHYTSLLSRSIAPRIKFGDSVLVGRSTWFNIVYEATGHLNIVIDDNCRVSANSVISAKNYIHLERDVILAPSVLIMDHNHAFEDPSQAIINQGTTEGGKIRIGRGSHIGHGAAVLCNRGELELGEHCVVEANAVVTRNVPPYSVVSGNPAKVVRQFDPVHQAWITPLRSTKTEPTTQTY